MAESGEPGAPQGAHPKPGGCTLSEAKGRGCGAPQAGDGGGAVAESKAEAEGAQSSGEGGEEDPAAAGSPAGTRRGVTGVAGRERVAAAPGSPHLASGGRNSGCVSWGSSGDMLAGSDPRTVAARASAASAAGVTNGTLEPGPQSELTNGSTEPVAKLNGAELRPATQV